MCILLLCRGTQLHKVIIPFSYKCRIDAVQFSVTDYLAICVQHPCWNKLIVIFLQPLYFLKLQLTSYMHGKPQQLVHVSKWIIISSYGDYNNYIELHGIMKQLRMSSKLYSQLASQLSLYSYRQISYNLTCIIFIRV